MQGRIYLALALGICAAAAGSAETTNHLSTAGPGNRYLVVVETSRTMERRCEGITRSLEDLLRSGFNGQIRRGDSLGLWTFNEKLITGKFPVQQLHSDSQSKVGSSVAGFLRLQKFEKQGRLEKVLPAMQWVATNSQLLTVILVSSGVELKGTPFDDAINAVYNQWRSQQQEKRMPFVTLLRARKGVITDYAVSPAPWPVELPPLPAEAIVQTRPAATNAPVRMLPPLIVSGKKTESLPPPQVSAAGVAKLAAAPPAGSVQSPSPVGAQTSRSGSTNNFTAASSNPPVAAITVTAPTPSTDVEKEAVPSKATANDGRSVGSEQVVAKPETARTELPAEKPARSASAAVKPETPLAADAPVPATTVTAEPSTPVQPVAAAPQVATALARKGHPIGGILAGVVGGGIVLLLGVGILYHQRSAARRADHVSLITRSLTRADH